MAGHGAPPGREILARPAHAGAAQDSRSAKHRHRGLADRWSAHARSSCGIGTHLSCSGSHRRAQRQPLHQVSPTTAEHVRQGLGARVDYVLDGGPCAVGIESTVLSLAGEVPVLLRPGGISRQQIEALIGSVKRSELAPDGSHSSPGMHPRHYSPRTPVVLVDDGRLPRSGAGVYHQINRPPIGPVIEIIAMPNTAAEYAARLYSVLHALDAWGYDWIAVEIPGSGVEWEAVMDRLRRAASSQT